MTAKEKAEELYQIYLSNLWYADRQNAKDCAKFLVKEILESDRLTLSTMDRGWWEQVLNQIEKIN